MAKPYFSHDYNSRSNPKLVAIEMKLGRDGRMTYWDIVELIHEQGGYLFIKDIPSIAYTLRTTKEVVLDIVQNYNLFEFDQDGERFCTERALRNIEKQKDLIEKKIRGGKASAEKRALAQQNPTGVDQNVNTTSTQSNINTNQTKLNQTKLKDSVISSETTRANFFTIEQVLEECQIVGLSPEVGQIFFDKRQAVGWKDGLGRDIVDLRSALRNWKVGEYDKMGKNTKNNLGNQNATSQKHTTENRTVPKRGGTLDDLAEYQREWDEERRQQKQSNGLLPENTVD